MTTAQDDEHLLLLSIFYYIFAGLSAFVSCFTLVFVVIGGLLTKMPRHFAEGGQPPPEFLGPLIAAVGLALLALGLGWALLQLLTGRFLTRRRHYRLCFVVAILTCLSGPFGIILGVFTIVVLSRPSVRASFVGVSSSSPPASS